MQRLVNYTSRSLGFLTKASSVKSASRFGSGSLFGLVAQQSRNNRTYSSNINRHGVVAKRTGVYSKELAIRTQICGSRSLFEQKNYMIVRNISNVSI
jgi:hypothetical protein